MVSCIKVRPRKRCLSRRAEGLIFFIETDAKALYVTFFHIFKIKCLVTFLSLLIWENYPKMNTRTETGLTMYVTGLFSILYCGIGNFANYSDHWPQPNRARNLRKNIWAHFFCPIPLLAAEIIDSLLVTERQIYGVYVWIMFFC